MLEECKAPFINEDELPNPTRTGLKNDDGTTHGFVCPYCTEAFAAQDFKPVKDAQEAAKVCKELRHSQASLRYGSNLTLAGNARKDGTIAGAGVLALVACSVLMKVFYCARFVRVDINRSVTFLAQTMTKWSADCDERLESLMWLGEAIRIVRSGRMGWRRDS